MIPDRFLTKTPVKSGVTLLLLSAWFLAWFLFFFSTSYHLYWFSARGNDVILGADTQGFILIQQKNVREIIEGKDDDVVKHPLAQLVFHQSMRVIMNITGWHVHRAIQLTVAGFSALNMLLMLVMLRVFFVNQPVSLYLATFYGLCFGNLVIFSIPETYAVTISLVILFIFVFLRFRISQSKASVVAMGVLSGLAGMCNPSMLTLALIPSVYAFLTRGSREALTCGGTIILISMGMFVTTVFTLFGTSYFTYSVDYTEKWGSLQNFLDFSAVTNVFLHFFLYAIIGAAPTIKEATAYTAHDLTYYIRSLTGALCLVAYLSGLLYLARYISRSFGETELAVTIWLGVMVVFYIFFNPREAILYSALILPILFCLLAAGWGRVPEKRFSTAVPAAFVVVLGIHNVSILFATQSGR